MKKFWLTVKQRERICNDLRESIETLNRELETKQTLPAVTDLLEQAQQDRQVIINLFKPSPEEYQ